MFGAVVVDSLTTNDGVMINSGKDQYDVGREMSADIDVRHFNSCQSRPAALAVIRRHKIIIQFIDIITLTCRGRDGDGRQ